MWLALAFFPVEDEAELTRMRALLSPFMKNVRKCGEMNRKGRARIVNDITNTASSDVDQELIDRLNRVMNRAENGTLNLEHNALRAMNIR